MQGEFGGYRPKEQPDLELQFSAANIILDPGKELLRPPSVEKDEILSMSVTELKKKYSRRYEMYVKIVRELRHHESDDQLPTLTEEDIEHMRKWLLALNSLDEYIAHHKNPEAEGKTLRGERQIGVFDDIRNFVEGGGMEGYVKLPTGFGKTVLFVELVKATNLRSLVVVPTLTLLDQTAIKFDKFAPDVKYGKVSGEGKDFDQQVTIITYNSLLNHLADGTLDPKAYDCLILDEAHTALSEGRTDAIREFGHALKLGFTATPTYKTREKEVSKLLGAEIHRLNIREAVEDGYLSSFRNLVARTKDVDLSKIKINADGDYNEEQLEKAINIKERNLKAVNLYKQAFAGQTAVVYCVGVKHAQKVAELYQEEGVTAAYIEGNMNPDERRKILEDYAAGNIKVLCNADLLIAGFDEQSASVCINLRPTKSRVVAEQRGGRVLRLDDNNPDKFAYIVDVIDTGTEQSGQVLFSDVAAGVEIVHKEKKKRKGGGGGKRIDFSHIKIDGIEIIFDTEEVLEIQRKLKINEVVELISDLEKLKASIKMSGLIPGDNSKKTYREARENNHPNWPSNPEKLDGWRGYPDLWGKEIATKISYEKLKNEARLAKINTRSEYLELAKKKSNWPRDPEKYYDEEWEGWPVFLRDKKLIDDLALLKIAVASLGVTPKGNLAVLYNDIQKNHADWPANPYKMKGWKSWPDFWGLEKEGKRESKKINNLTELKQEIETSIIARGVNLKKTYKEACKTRENWPRKPDKLKGWKGYPDLFEFVK